VLRIADAAKERALQRIEKAPEDLSASAPRRFLAGFDGDWKGSCRIKPSILLPNPQAALRKNTDPPPLSIAGLKDPIHDSQGCRVSLRKDTP
jgi:hypothetical protein